MKVFSLFACILALGLLSGCAFTEFKTERPPVKDDRISFVENGNFGLKPLAVVTKTDDEGCLNADVTFELGGSPFLTWYFCGAPMQTLVYRFDWVDAGGNVLQGKVRKVCPEIFLQSDLLLLMKSIKISSLKFLSAKKNVIKSAQKNAERRQK